MDGDTSANVAEMRTLFIAARGNTQCHPEHEPMMSNAREMGSLRPSLVVVTLLPRPALHLCDVLSRLFHLRYACLSACQAYRSMQEVIYAILLLAILKRVSFVRHAMSQTHQTSAMQWA